MVVGKSSHPSLGFYEKVRAAGKIPFFVARRPSEEAMSSRKLTADQRSKVADFAGCAASPRRGPCSRACGHLWAARLTPPPTFFFSRRSQLNLSDEQSARFLAANSWNPNSAANAFFESGEAPKGKVAAAAAGTGAFSAAAAAAEFARLRDPAAEPPEIGMDQFMGLAKELGVDVET